ncbi:MAG: hypothetical protein QF913_07825 [Nitrospinaceae bacterium]|jgi:hypothetical protein|nr:hypothetical protein [Nitrospinaceae bacterium]
MDGETFARKQSALKTLLQQFDIPESRRELNKSDIRWLSRNLAVNNKSNPMLETAIGLIKWLLKNDRRKGRDIIGFKPVKIGDIELTKSGWIQFKKYLNNK